MKRLLIVVIIMACFMSVSCGNQENTETLNGDTDISLNEQTLYQLGVAEPTEQTATEAENADDENYIPINYEKQAGMWFTYMEYRDMLYNKTESEFTESIKNRLAQAAETGINTVYVHVRAYNDCCYESDIFPCAASNACQISFSS